MARDTVVIIGPTRQAAREKLLTAFRALGITEKQLQCHDYYDEATLDGYRLIAFAGTAENECYLRAEGFEITLIIVGSIPSIAMRQRINHVLSAQKRRKHD